MKRSPLFPHGAAPPVSKTSFVKKIPFTGDPFELYLRLRRPGTPSVLLESASVSGEKGRYSVIATRPFLLFEASGSKARISSEKRTEISAAPLEALKKTLSLHAKPGGHAALSFLGGAIGYFGYEAKNWIEPHLPQRKKSAGDLPDAYFLFFDEGVLLDHVEGSAAIFAGGKKGRAAARYYEAALKTPKTARLRKTKAAPADVNAIESSFSRDGFIAAVKKAKEYIRKGDIFQANLSQRFSFPVKEDAAAIYRRLRRINPSSFFGFLDAGDFQILSGSPERLVKLEGGVLETRPIAGTRSRGKTAGEDARRSLDLLLSEKERAEHIMLVDLVRNDMGRVAEWGSVAANELMTLEDYSHVKHIVSNVRGRLRDGLTAVDALAAFFPGGTITGAPKVRCMEIIDELEPVARGPYTGSLGYFSFDGNMDFNILIRSLVLKNGSAHLQVGAGIVADSVPEKEYAETLYKAEAVLNAVFGERETRRFFRSRGVGARSS